MNLMKYLILFIIPIISGCATISEYNQGCRDGLYSLSQEQNTVETICNELDFRRNKKNLEMHTMPFEPNRQERIIHR